MSCKLLLLLLPLQADDKALPHEAARPGRGYRSLLDEIDLSGLLADNRAEKWFELAAGILVGWIAGRLLAAVLRGLARRCQRRGWNVQQLVLSGLAGPASLAILTLGLAAGLSNLAMSGALTLFWSRTLLLLYSIATVWYGSNLVGLVDLLFRRLRSGSALDQQLAPLVRKTLRFLLLVLGVLFVVNSVFDRDIGAWLAGLGIAGLAVSLAAQDSLKNLFGSITILVDRPFLVGQSISYGGYEGLVEEIGFRSTKLRTVGGTLVTIPNSKIVNDPVENMDCRYFRRSFSLKILSSTPPEQVAQALAVLAKIFDEEAIREPVHPLIDGERLPPRIYFSDFAAEGLSISVTYWYAPPSWWDFQEHAQKVNLRIVEAFFQAGIGWTPSPGSPPLGPPRPPQPGPT
jgi:MscS family membrane protein